MSAILQSKLGTITYTDDYIGSIAGLELEQEFTGVSKYLTVSIGVAYTYPEKGSSFKSLYDSASDAMYTAKENGRNCAVCDGTVYGRMKNGVGTAIGN